MVLSPEVRDRKIREAAERHGWTPKQVEDQLRSYVTRVKATEAELLDAIIQMPPEVLRWN